MTFEIILSTIGTSLIGTFLFAYIATKIPFKLPNNHGTGKYVGPLPFFGAIIGTLCGLYLNRIPVELTGGHYQAFLFLIAFALIGFLRDRFNFKIRSIFILALPVAICSMYCYNPSLPWHKLLSYSFFIIFIIFCLKLASMVYEMPFILISASALTHIIYLYNVYGNSLAAFLNFSLMMFAVMAIIQTFSRTRLLMSNSGLFSTGFVLAASSLMESSGTLILFSLLIPVMTFLFPLIFVTLTLTTTYFGNKLHKSNEIEKHLWSWSLCREKVIKFAALIFLSFNFLGLLLVMKSPAFGYISLFVLLIFAIWSFVKAFAQKNNTIYKPEPQDQINILDTKIDAVLPNDVLRKIKDHISKEKPGLMHIITADSLALVRVGQDQSFKSIMEAAELVVPDGAGIVWAADFLGTPLPGRVPGVALVSQICEASAKEGHKVFLIGSKPGIATQASEILKQNTSVSFAGVEHGYFAKDSDEEKAMLQKIADSNADIVFVAMGVPRQEDFITKLRNYLDHGVAIGVGGSFDVISGTLPRAPQWMQRCGIEWLFRLWLEPKRIGRMLEIPRFVIRIMRYKLNSD